MAAAVTVAHVRAHVHAQLGATRPHVKNLYAEHPAGAVVFPQRVAAGLGIGAKYRERRPCQLLDYSTQRQIARRRPHPRGYRTRREGAAQFSRPQLI